MSEGMRASLSTGKELFDAAIARSSWTQVQLRRKANRSELRRLLPGLKPSQAAGVAAGQLQGLAPALRQLFFDGRLGFVTKATSCDTRDGSSVGVALYDPPLCSPATRVETNPYCSDLQRVL
jgi:hypothetical protein